MRHPSIDTPRGGGLLFGRRGCVASLVGVTLLAPVSARAMCDVIPGVSQEFRGAVGSVNRPFAIPHDEGEEILLRVRPGVCAPASSGFADLPGGLVPEDDYFVTVFFEPPGAAPRNAVVLASAANQDLCAARVAAAGPLPNGGTATCVAIPTVGRCAGGPSEGVPCGADAECPDGSCVALPGRPDLSIHGECVGGSRSRERCTADAECPSASCEPVVLRFRFPDTDTRLGDPGDDRTLTGPATIAVTPVLEPLPFGLAASRCAETPGLVACVDELYAHDGTCETGPDHVDPTFGHFTALPPANDYQALCGGTRRRSIPTSRRTAVSWLSGPSPTTWCPACARPATSSSTTAIRGRRSS